VQLGLGKSALIGLIGGVFTAMLGLLAAALHAPDVALVLIVNLAGLVSGVVASRAVRPKITLSC
jgi:hypothetical protein